MNTGVVIGNKLENQIFDVSHSGAWNIKIRQLLSLKRSRNFFSFNVHVHMACKSRSHPCIQLYFSIRVAIVYILVFCLFAFVSGQCY